MNTRLLAAAAAILLPAAALAECPNYELMGANSAALNAKNIGNGIAYDVVAGGDNYLPECGFQGVEAYVTNAPDFSFDMSGVAGRYVILSVTSACDAAMVVNNVDGKWYYDDDSNGDLDPKVNMPGADGWLDVWIGTYDGAYCDARLTIQVQ